MRALGCHLVGNISVQKRKKECALDHPPGMADEKLDGNEMDFEGKWPIRRPLEQPRHMALKAGLERGQHLDPHPCGM